MFVHSNGDEPSLGYISKVLKTSDGVDVAFSTKTPFR